MSYLISFKFFLYWFKTNHSSSAYFFSITLKIPYFNLIKGFVMNTLLQLLRYTVVYHVGIWVPTKYNAHTHEEDFYDGKRCFLTHLVWFGFCRYPLTSLEALEDRWWSQKQESKLFWWFSGNLWRVFVVFSLPLKVLFESFFWMFVSCYNP